MYKKNRDSFMLKKFYEIVLKSKDIETKKNNNIYCLFNNNKKITKKSTKKFYVYFEEYLGTINGEITNSIWRFINLFIKRVLIGIIKSIKIKSYRSQKIHVNSIQLSREFKNITFYGKEMNGNISIIGDDSFEKIFFLNGSEYLSNRILVLLKIQNELGECSNTIENKCIIPKADVITVNNEYISIRYQYMDFVKMTNKLNIQHIYTDLSDMMDLEVNEMLFSSIEFSKYLKHNISSVNNEKIRCYLFEKSKIWLRENMLNKTIYQLSHGDFWHGNIFEYQNKYCVIDFDRMAYMPRYYDLVHYIIQFFIDKKGGLNRWFNNLFSSNDLSGNFVISFNSTEIFQKIKCEILNDEFLDSIFIKELIFAEIWVYRFIIIYLCNSDYIGKNTDIKLFVEYIDSIKLEGVFVDLFLKYINSEKGALK